MFFHKRRNKNQEDWVTHGPHARPERAPWPQGVREDHTGPPANQHRPFRPDRRRADGAAQRERFHFHLESCQAHRGTGHAARGLDVLSVAGRGRAGSRGRQGSAGTTPSTLDSNTGHVRARGAQPDSLGLKHAHFFLPWFREGRGREKEGINVNSYGGKPIFFSRSKNLISTVSFLRPSHSYQRLVH